MSGTFFKPDTAFPIGSSVIQRFGLICWWSALALAVGAVIGAPLLVAFGDPSGGFDVIWFGIGYGAALWLAGRAALFLFAGR